MEWQDLSYVYTHVPTRQGRYTDSDSSTVLIQGSLLLHLSIVYLTRETPGSNEHFSPSELHRKLICSFDAFLLQRTMRVLVTVSLIMLTSCKTLELLVTFSVGSWKMSPGSFTVCPILARSSWKHFFPVWISVCPRSLRWLLRAIEMAVRPARFQANEVHEMLPHVASLLSQSSSLGSTPVLCLSGHNGRSRTQRAFFRSARRHVAPRSSSSLLHFLSPALTFLSVASLVRAGEAQGMETLWLHSSCVAGQRDEDKRGPHLTT